MNRRALKVLLVVFFVAAVAVLTVTHNQCAPVVQLTRIGNPPKPEPRPTASVLFAEGSCEKLMKCHPSLVPPVCKNGIMGTAGVPEKLGLLPAKFPSLNEAVLFEEAGLLGYNSKNLSSCISDLEKISCSTILMQNSYISSAPQPFSLFPKAIPTDICSKVFETGSSLIRAQLSATLQNVEVSDLDADGLVDLIGSNSSGKIYFYRGSDLISGTSAGSYVQTSGIVIGLKVGRLEANGPAVIAALHRSEVAAALQTVELFEVRSGTLLSIFKRDLDSPNRGIDWFDFKDINLDGRLDLIVSNDLSNLTYLLNLGGANFSTKNDFNLSASLSSTVAFARSSVEGYDALAVGLPSSLRFFSGLAGAWTPSTLVNLSQTPDRLFFKDLDRDFKAELIVATLGNNFLKIYSYGANAVTFLKDVSVPPFQKILIEDINQDGFSDLILLTSRQEYSVGWGRPDFNFQFSNYRLGANIGDVAFNAADPEKRLYFSLEKPEVLLVKVTAPSF